jgi:hypothetical protein
LNERRTDVCARPGSSRRPKGRLILTVVRLRARVFSDGTGACAELPILLTEEGPMFPLLDYLLMRSQERSLSWMRKVVQAVQLMLRFIDANERHFPGFRVLNAFGRRLYRRGRS